MRLSLLVSPTGLHAGAWRLPEAQVEKMFEFSRYVETAQTAERGFFDLLFVADVATLFPSKPKNLGRGSIQCVLEPVTLLSALSAVTKEIGLAGTISTSYSHPYQVARMMASLDHISRGRAAWNLVTSANPNEAPLFGLSEPMPVEERYRRAKEFVDVVCQLWDCWDDDAFIFDTENGQFFDPTKMHPTHFEGEHIKVDGMLSMPRSPQGRPMIAQAGQSEAGMTLAGQTADIVFTQQAELESAKKFYKSIKSRAVAAGRRPEDICVMPGLMAFVANTEAEAIAKRKRADEAFDVSVGIDSLSVVFGIDLSDYAPDKPLPKDLPTSDISLSQRDTLLGLADRDNLTLRQLVQTVASRNHWILCGTPTTVADGMEQYFNEGAADAFMLFPGVMSEDLDSFVELVVPELQRRGLVRTEPNGTTLREKFGLGRPRIS